MGHICNSKRNSLPYAKLVYSSMEIWGGTRDVLVKARVRVHYGKYWPSRHAPSVIFPVVYECNQCFYWLIVDLRCATMPTNPLPCLKLSSDFFKILLCVILAVQVVSLVSHPSDMDIDRSVISPSLINPGWDDPTKFTYNPDFDLGVDADFLSTLTSAAVDNDGKVFVEQGQANIEPLSAAQSVANASNENPSKHLKLSLSRAKPCEEVRPPMRVLMNNDDAGSSGRFTKPISSPEHKKAAQDGSFTNCIINISLK